MQPDRAALVERRLVDVGGEQAGERHDVEFRQRLERMTGLDIRQELIGAGVADDTSREARGTTRCGAAARCCCHSPACRRDSCRRPSSCHRRRPARLSIEPLPDSPRQAGAGTRIAGKGADQQVGLQPVVGADQRAAARIVHRVRLGAARDAAEMTEATGPGAPGAERLMPTMFVRLGEFGTRRERGQLHPRAARAERRHALVRGRMGDEDLLAERAGHQLAGCAPSPRQGRYNPRPRRPRRRAHSALARCSASPTW